MIDDFGLKYINNKYVNHLISEPQEKYEATQDWTGGLYCGIKLKWDYKKKQLDISIPGYVKDALHKFQHPTSTRPQHSPHQWTAQKYGSTAHQLVHPEDESPALNSNEANTVQQVIVTFLYYARAVEPKMLVALNTIVAQQLKTTQETAKKVVQLLNYVATHPEEITKYHAIRMTLHMHSNTYFLSAQGEKSRYGGYHYLSEPSLDPSRSGTYT